MVTGSGELPRHLLPLLLIRLQQHPGRFDERLRVLLEIAFPLLKLFLDSVSNGKGGGRVGDHLPPAGGGPYHPWVTSFRVFN